MSIIFVWVLQLIILSNASQTTNIECDNAISAYFNGLQSAVKKPWALTSKKVYSCKLFLLKIKVKVLDASAKIPPGLIPTAYKTHMGNVMTHIGNFDECLAIAVAEGDTKFRGQYCRATLELSTTEVCT